MWHASISDGERVEPARAEALWALAERALDGVGDAALGEWRELGGRAVHLRRRVRPEEWGRRPWGQDVRATTAGWIRLEAVAPWLPRWIQEDEMNGKTAP